jgi:serine/threonine-protein phosphatase 5
MKNFFLALEPEYDGPHLEVDGRVTKEFMLALLPHFENQKKLHKKYAYQVQRYVFFVK